MTALAKYDAMVHAIAECQAVDEVKDIRDKAAALEAYYRQARNLEAERQAANIRLRAERKAGELLKELARATPEETARAGGHGKAATSTPLTQQESPYAKALSDTGISRQTAHQFQALANVPEEDFEAVLEGPARPSRAALLKTTKQEPQVSDPALWLWGRLRDFETMGYLSAYPHTMTATMTDAMRADVRRLAPLVANFLKALETEHEPA